jgi:steroid Delta-isomerase
MTEPYRPSAHGRFTCATVTVGVFMAGQAYDVLKQFWDIQDGGDYSKVAPLFSDDATLVDPVFGTFVGGEAIAAFMAKMNVEMAKIGASFRLVELSGDDETVWAQWEAVTNNGARTGVGIYKVRNGKIIYYRDYMNAPEGKP